MAAASAATLLAGCLPPRYVSRNAPPPVDVAREAAKASAPAPAATATPSRTATPAPAAPPRSLADLVDLALSRDPATRATWYDARAAAAQAGSRLGAYLPTIDASASVSRQEQGGSPIRAAFGQTAWGASAAITWLLLDAGARGALVDEGERLLLAARLAEHAAVADLVLRVQQGYFGYLGARALVEAQSAAARQAEANLASAEGRQKAGLATIADVLQARTALSQSRLALQQLEGQALALRGGLASLAGLPPTAELDVGALPLSVDAGAVRPAVEELLAAASLRNPDLARAEAAAEAAEARATAASRALWPTLSLQGSISHTFYLDPIQTDTETWSAALVLRLPLLDGLGLRPAYDALAARANADAAHARADATSQRVALDVWTSYQALRTAGQRVGTSKDLVGSARASVEVAQGRYKEGVGSILDLLTAQAALEQALAEDVRSRADFLVALAQLARASGRLDLPESARSPASAEGTRTP
ncbi:MAG TPA: TolC family protein [Anaeromyxobacter sp.]